MYLSALKIKGYKAFKDDFIATFNPGLNILVGENGSGKSSLIDAIRLILMEDEYGRSGIDSSVFHKPIDQPAKAKGASRILIRCEFESLSDDEQVAYLPWLDLNRPSRAYLNLGIENKENALGKYKRKIWGNESESGLFEWELLHRIVCIYLPPLRDAQEKLKAYKGSRLARLLKNLKQLDGLDEPHSLERKFAAFNKDLLKDESIKSANKSIQENLIKTAGHIFGQDASIQFSEINFDRIVERLRLLFYPLVPDTGTETGLSMFRDLEENSLGFNNIIYLATILAELEGLSDDHIAHKILLIEEPEAHLHPQLQIKLLHFLQEKSRDDNIQIIVTTHSPTLASSVDINAIKVLTAKKPGESIAFTAVSKCHLEPSTKYFIQRWLDITKSILLFAKGVLMVEGIAEALVLKELAPYALRNLASINPSKSYFTNLDDYGISIINLNGIYFNHFMSLFKGYRKNPDGTLSQCDYIKVKCAGLTDNDPPPDSAPTPQAPAQGTNNQLYMIAELQANSPMTRLFSNLKTFEYDLAMSGNNLSLMAEVQLTLLTTAGPVRQMLSQYAAADWSIVPLADKATASLYLINHIDKGEFAQHLAQRLTVPDTEFSIPPYIADAFSWLLD